MPDFLHHLQELLEQLKGKLKESLGNPELNKQPCPVPVRIPK